MTQNSAHASARRGAFTVPGVLIGHRSLGDTGVTACVSEDPAGLCAAVDVRGGGPGTRETDLLEPHNTVERVHAIMLTGGSAFGLAAADGAMAQLESRGIGFPVFGEGVPGPRVPIVPAAVIFDLAVGDAAHRPGPADGAAAVSAAFGQPAGVDSGNVGAGCGATAGVLRGGFGTASVSLAGPGSGYRVAAAVVANPHGSVVDPGTGRLYGDCRLPPVDTARLGALSQPTPQLNTTIGLIATDCPFAPAQLKRLAMAGHDGLARAVRPAHSPLDGDTFFAVSTAAPMAAPMAVSTSGGEEGVDTLSAACEAAAEAVQGAIVDAIVTATTNFGVTAWADLAGVAPLGHDAH
ncbi:P1 family peptidase [Corynebacterium liangguodongii]|uniref:Peptidase n=1 Tax=Corynebacterium liangguodongii TaxID=2079535 RepID=A0A2S0WFM8_9CORY|nr:P1 family peptidase [Corynebacterium liangguodongii]AWB84578.1 peptidase [Corynebacterium liangguodongii]PWB98837.1 peptidase S58 family protein [Corynebacterium liangguodongii]